MINLQDIGQRLQDERKRLGMSQGDLAEHFGISRAAQAGYEAGRNAADVTYVLKAHAIGVDMDYVLHGTRMAEAAWSKFDWDLAQDIAAGIQEVAKELKLKIGPEKIIPLLKVIYRLVAKERAGKLDKDTVRDVLRLAA